ncbi:protein disulfide oxidoreductase [Actinobacillus pleuropneumoniae]|uniref:Protein disulfide oxidoreductase n=5 Tax=Actinobacillus pleuropneumoniae TaxID=715 RepID=A0A223MCB2_ACTPL|nr:MULTISPECIES: protein disulfide oxidoreductase [Actinobacillus]ABY70056.1 thioredoxin-like protein [Actinobacillus pleuropneumoniae serovar 3 str. JL03]ACE62139.1 thioredoxin-like protein [Actinobacillus pleuropneumoniae serovar 7 str. AP76]ASU15245.1 Sporulation thiol-disulfide oxidoreductase A [Actinobacillus pleuropneumoniae]AWG95835.1 protein disulfide oxidoreductase [Actinobacillus pleuropneumoniae serovar 1 str. 4074]AXA21905.1 protein disulfide oxidoreductase [Actinobacillus pleuropn
MQNKYAMLSRFGKNIFFYGLMFIVLSTVIDWYRKPSAPNQFAQQVLYDLQHQPKMIAQLSHDRPMLLYFWGSWCTYCKFTSPAIQQFADENVPVLSVALKSGTPQDVVDYLKQEDYRFPVINDPDGVISKSWDIQATPTVLIIKDGEIVQHTTGLTSYWGLKVRLWLSNLT